MKVRRRYLVPTVLLAVSASAQPALAADCDVSRGRAVFESKCTICHISEPGDRNTAGPNLWHVVGRAVASRPGFGYSPALRAFGGTWLLERLDKFLTDPQGTVPGTYMAFTGIRRAADREAALCFLNAAMPAGPVG